MKILHLIDIPWWSGLSSYAFDCVQAQTGSGHQVLLACQKDGLPSRRALALGIETVPISGRKSWQAPGNWIRIFLTALRFRPDWIIAHTGSTHWIAWSIGKILGIPFIRTRATAQPAKPGALNRYLYGEARWVVAASDNIADECRASFGLSDSIRSLFPPVRIRSETKRQPSSLTVGMVARLDPVKGHSVLIKAAKAVTDAVPEAEFHLAGPEESTAWAELLKECRKLGLNRVRYHGCLEHSEVSNFMSGCRFGVVASLGSEEVSRALLEWMAEGKPVVATQVGCIPQILEEGVGGYLVPPGNHQALADRLKNLLLDPELAEKMGSHNQEVCRKRFSPESFGKAWDQLLSDQRGDV